MKGYFSAFKIEKKINLLIFAIFASRININFPTKSVSCKLFISSALVVDASITAVTPLNDKGKVSGIVKSP
uniref:Photosystem I assembly protein Ycf3 n=1 Tax=Heterosigma akashiwo TaxID=2829 RepID=A0A224AMW4_HETAK|nr:photosystem I assembly protein Ycf3 [Heterosigma akashiwo]BBA18339.1 photosystem I assembly protein Ycf3 [Heterosigma akashiwo]BBA18478.1 photosystem I assembly protein Ycf3 [Heterosigma akashiwo]BBA18616.1 photosystem I assembly protein Ycf3 [Heterosigma akashiwo]BBA18755.1 photosystem I assembly protein Ycf3 [Heterosigma akashiwo]